jgi:hypothetical protein
VNLFAHLQTRAGFDSFGNEVTKFDPKLEEAA